ncbi:hypothetical protein SAMN04489796_1099 [Winogradskyella thalassocola]|uniref:Uncharacterized protein n=2 Tax=Winogradskyella thalassocola TaxID=262004 RepID=A0A1G8J8Y4_9FLAO|nr:hypothetical protein SAMN04489796_1099 [Winogradskyella thalassocola]
MPPPKTRKEMEHNLALVFEDTLKKLESNDKSLKGSVLIFTAPHLKKVKSTPNFRLNLLTIDESIRLQANMLEWMK